MLHASKSILCYTGVAKMTAERVLLLIFHEDKLDLLTFRRKTYV